MPLSDVEIQEALDNGEIGITPFDEKMLQPASYDLKIGKLAATVPINGDPRVNLEKEGVLLIPAYAPAVIFTLEELRFSRSYIGHIGLTSTMARRGVQASLGIQIDPEFKAPLSITLQNQTPNAVTLNYKDPFVTLEIEKLARPASKGYEGTYQGKTTFSAEELEPLIGFKGHALTDVVRGFEDIRDAVHGVAQMSQKLDTFMQQHLDEIRSSQRFTQALMSENQALFVEMKKLVQHIVGERISTVVPRALSPEEAKREILDLFRSTRGPLFYSDIAERLQIDLEQVLEITNELEREGLIGELGNHGPAKS
jgi:deoxycytidine triphosphate deaminase